MYFGQPHFRFSLTEKLLSETSFFQDLHTTCKGDIKLLAPFPTKECIISQCNREESL